MWKISIHSLPADAGRVYDAIFKRFSSSLKATPYSVSHRATFYYYPKVSNPPLGPGLKGSQD